jgi:hypothetical protein
MERAYDFHELLSCANTLNQLSAIEYGINGLKFGLTHNKMENIWSKLYPLGESEVPANLGNYSSIENNDMLVMALKEGFKEAQSMLRVLNMAPTVYARDKRWFTEPWRLERTDGKHMAYVPSQTPVAREDGDSKVMQEATTALERA